MSECRGSIGEIMPMSKNDGLVCPGCHGRGCGSCARTGRIGDKQDRLPSIGGNHFPGPRAQRWPPESKKKLRMPTGRLPAGVETRLYPKVAAILIEYEKSKKLTCFDLNPSERNQLDRNMSRIKRRKIQMKKDAEGQNKKNKMKKMEKDLRSFFDTITKILNKNHEASFLICEDALKHKIEIFLVAYSGIISSLDRRQATEKRSKPLSEAIIVSSRLQNWYSFKATNI
jgi:hypothetical protein